MVEEICRDLAKSDADWSIGLLRYFNPVGARVRRRLALAVDESEGV